MFDDLVDFPKVKDISVGPEDGLGALDDQIKNAFGEDVAPTREYFCGGTTPCIVATNKVKELSELRIHLTIAGEKQEADIGFDSLGLPSIGFIPDDQKLHATLDWTVNATLIADTGGLRLAPAANAPELDLDATIATKAVVDQSYLVDLGALKVRATTKTQPQFKGHLLVDIAEDGSFDFSFGSGTGFHAKWGLQTEDSPLMGVKGELAIDWALAGSGVNPGELHDRRRQRLPEHQGVRRRGHAGSRSVAA